MIRTHGVREVVAPLGAAARYEVTLDRYTTYRIGGPAAAIVDPASVEEVMALLRIVSETGIPLLILGLGSNVLISDAGFDGVVLRLGKGLASVERSVEGDRRVWRIGGGLPTPRLARLTAEAGLSGVHKLIGVPGTVGGGVFMNAGAHGQDFASIVRNIEVVDARGEKDIRPASAIPWEYRDAGLRDVVVMRSTLEFSEAPVDGLVRDLRKHFVWRKRGTPFSDPCCGSVFRNPEVANGRRRPAGQLADGAGLKGFRIGGAQVSPIHANYIVNTGGATADDVRAVIDHVRERVTSVFGVELKLEVKIIGA